MALQIYSPSCLTKKSYQHLLYAPVLLSKTKPKLRIQSQNPTTDTENTKDSATLKKSTARGLGFGSSSPAASTKNPNKASASDVTSKKKQKGKRERASIIRRTPVEKPSFVSQVDETKAKEQSKNESAFLLAWLGLGGIILVEGIVLAASGCSAHRKWSIECLYFPFPYKF
ncbi:protein LOW PSII ACCUMULATION 2, chloroplastic isoform X2 [Jatropha curcas]|uniref:protein LOW PSII ACCUMULATION 2, chloroplastic isoform X2 n=1 Tax=Jatropha curcas TaxID=180498 RepID=UPI0018941823|nr:protein LOW PSII ACCUMULATION 2, chloroplastic isoform X2 [Jatropha curcas]